MAGRLSSYELLGRRVEGWRCMVGTSFSIGRAGICMCGLRAFEGLHLVLSAWQMHGTTPVHGSDVRLSSSRSSHVGSDSGVRPQASDGGLESRGNASDLGDAPAPRDTDALRSRSFDEAVHAVASRHHVNHGEFFSDTSRASVSGEPPSNDHRAHLEEIVIAMLDWALVAITSELRRRSEHRHSSAGSQMSRPALRSRREPPQTQADPAPRKAKGASNALSRRRNNPQQTLILRHIPCRIRDGQVREFLDNHGFEGTYSSVAVPVDHRTEGNRGYAFVKFRSDEDLARGLVELAGKRFPGGSSEKVTATDVAVGRGRG
mmetsp:Transcript_88884/g.237950  ORF Transcript_88884/g.237950 Transcript_88884/m.237950 type:complete len:318 (+) Transcript_88884:2064-3017(+)